MTGLSQRKQHARSKAEGWSQLSEAPQSLLRNQKLPATPPPKHNFKSLWVQRPL